MITHKSAAEWISENPILSAGQMGNENDTILFKIGTGYTAWNDLPYPPAAEISWGNVVGTLSSQTDVQAALDAKSATSHNHNAAYEPINANIQAHVVSTHAPPNAQKNSDITLAEIEAKLVGTISTHTHAGSGGDALVANPLSQFAQTTSLQLKNTISDETGSGALVFAASPALTSPTGIVKGDVGLGSVDNTSDVDAPVSTAQAAADTVAKARANHTGTQTASTVSDFNAAALLAAPAETTTTHGALINSASSKTTPVDADMVGLMDSAASNILKKLSWVNIKATLKTYFDTLYPSGSGTSTGSNTGDQSLAGLQPLDTDLTTIAGLTATTDNFLQSKSSAWASRTVAQVKTDLSLTGTNSGDQTSIAGITGTTAQFNTALTDNDFATGGGSVTGASSGTNTGDQVLPTDATIVTTDVTTNNVTTSKHGWFPKLPTATGLFLKDDLTWAAPGGVSDGDKGDITVTASGATWTIDAATVTEAKQVLADNTTQDVSITKHGYVPKAPNITTQFLRGDATWAVPAGGGGGTSLGLVVATAQGMHLG